MIEENRGAGGQKAPPGALKCYRGLKQKSSRALRHGNVAKTTKKRRLQGGGAAKHAMTGVHFRGPS
jgi:hypothetical protein